MTMRRTLVLAALTTVMTGTATGVAVADGYGGGAGGSSGGHGRSEDRGVGDDGPGYLGYYNRHRQSLDRAEEPATGPRGGRGGKAGNNRSHCGPGFGFGEDTSQCRNTPGRNGADGPRRLDL